MNIKIKEREGKRERKRKRQLYIIKVVNPSLLMYGKYTMRIISWNQYGINKMIQYVSTQVNTKLFTFSRNGRSIEITLQQNPLDTNTCWIR